MAVKIVDDPKMVDISEVRDICRERRYRKKLAELIAGFFESYLNSNTVQFLTFLQKLDIEVVFGYYLAVLRRIYDESELNLQKEIDYWLYSLLQNIRKRLKFRYSFYLGPYNNTLNL